MHHSPDWKAGYGATMAQKGRPAMVPLWHRLEGWRCTPAIRVVGLVGLGNFRYEPALHNRAAFALPVALEGLMAAQ